MVSIFSVSFFGGSLFFGNSNRFTSAAVSRVLGVMGVRVEMFSVGVSGVVATVVLVILYTMSCKWTLGFPYRMQRKLKESKMSWKVNAEQKDTITIRMNIRAWEAAKRIELVKYVQVKTLETIYTKRILLFPKKIIITHIY